MVRFALDDHFLLSRIKTVMLENDLDTVVETGLAAGDSAVEFCRFVSTYVGIDIDQGCVAQTDQKLRSSSRNTWTLYHGDSRDVLRSVMHLVEPAHTLFFFDAHNYGADPMWPKPTWPMPEEIRAVPRGQGVFCLHDFTVPGKDFGVDGYWVDTPEGRVLKPFDYDLIRDVLTEWSPSHRLEYMQESDPNSSYRGAAFVYPS